MKYLIIIMMFFQFGNLNSQNSFLEKGDKRLIKMITELCDKPNELNRFFIKKNKSPKINKLGFG